MLVRIVMQRLFRISVMACIALPIPDEAIAGDPPRSWYGFLHNAAATEFEPKGASVPAYNLSIMIGI